MNNSLKLVGVSILTLAILTGCLPSNTTSPSLSSEQANDFITVVGTGTATGVPDMATIYFGVNVVNNDLSSGVTEGNALMEGVSDALAEQGLAAEDIQTTGFSVWAEDRYSPETGQPTGERTYHVDNQVQVIVRDVSQVETIIDAALDAGANTINGLSFGLSETAALQSEARTEALENARTIAGEIADNIGVDLGDITSVSENNFNGVPIFQDRFMGGGGGGPSISEGQLSISTNVVVTFAVK